MRRTETIALAVATLIALPAAVGAQVMNEESRKVAGGGISVAGWAGKIDDQEATKGMKLEDASLMKMGNDLHVKTGPAVTYWNATSNKAAGDYTVKATFREEKYMELNNHPHPYGIVIAGNDMGTAQQSYLYCAAYGDGRFIVRGFGPAAFQMNGRQGAAAPSVNKAAGKGQPVTQEIAVTVKSGKVDCVINGAVVASYTKAELVAPGKLKSTDGVFGIRFAHNTEAVVSGLMMTKH
jgi:hypothetical protein